MTEMLPMTQTATTDASEGFTACVDLMVTLQTPKASSSSPTLERQTTLKTFLLKQRRWLTARAAAKTHLHPAFLVSMDGSFTILCWHLLDMAHISSAAGWQQQLRSDLDVGR
jgi:hypothetical protein